MGEENEEEEEEEEEDEVKCDDARDDDLMYPLHLALFCFHSEAKPAKLT